ncbi:single-stranded DNA-binding protein [Mucilaginibacter ginkgonis]|uniref:Single-stranded DNA-binding protein n=1 Tax=Mucilaginibacter ginkgonis TaxID=2682091 RepID=A0A6I4HXM8_9SPHI|nr:single-stranded DNA-binding protein [Mucilaginibacter ginkgonis]QQL49421.1 single-stranded DNA-binding protein [Mucilaginibacter ginkgonis]
MNNSGCVNKVILAGKITEDPYWLDGGKNKWLCFKLLTTEKRSSAKGETVQEELHQIKVHENCPSLSKIQLQVNDIIYLQGKIQTTAFVDGDNHKRYKTDVIANSIDQWEI